MSRSRAGGPPRPTTAKAPARLRLRPILEGLERAYPDAECALVHKNALQLLVATVLSAQCTDKRVNQVTKDLFEKYRKPEDYAAAPPGELEADIRSTGFFNNKAKALRGIGKALAQRRRGDVPQTMEELLELPGVARKTANVVLGTAFGIASGVVVDTHVFRIARRLGLTRADTPEKVERDLMKLLPRDAWIDFSHRMILHGRAICKARNPKCGGCPIDAFCPSAHRV